MEYDTVVTIEAPRDHVVAAFDNPDNMKKWQPGLVSFEPLEGQPGQPGATSRLSYKMGKREIEMIETVVSRNLPDEFSGTYDAKNVHNEIHNRFEQAGENQTVWHSHNRFVFSGFMKIAAPLMKGAFKKQTLKDMTRFKEFVESESSLDT